MLLTCIKCLNLHWMRENSWSVPSFGRLQISLLEAFFIRNSYGTIMLSVIMSTKSNLCDCINELGVISSVTLYLQLDSLMQVQSIISLTTWKNQRPPVTLFVLLNYQMIGMLITITFLSFKKKNGLTQDLLIKEGRCHLAARMLYLIHQD